MPKGFFTQCASILLEDNLALDAIESALGSFGIRGRSNPAAENWAFGGPALKINFRPEVNGYLCVDVVENKWPDSMGEGNRESLIFGAWATGQFGPFAYPENLERAMQQSWSWREAPAIVEKHKAFLRTRISYVFGASEDSPVLPSDYDAAGELMFLNEINLRLLQALPGALCYFNPNGEVLRSPEGFKDSLEHAHSQELPPLDVWSNIRLFRIDEKWSIMDTVGNSQLDVPDIEACFAVEQYEPNDVHAFLREVTWYLMRNGQQIAPGDGINGPGDKVWRAFATEEPLAQPPRNVLRWMPVDGIEAPSVLGGNIADAARNS